MAQVKYSIVRATQDHVTAMIPFVRDADKVEFMASCGRQVSDVLGACVQRSDEAWAGMVDDQVACIFGVASNTVLSSVGFPWMVGTDLIEAHSGAFLRRNKRMLASMLSRYGHLENYVDARNAKAIQWLKWLGFILHDPVPYGVGRKPFHKFEMRLKDV